MSLKEFQILGKLGSGSFGIVYKAKRKEDGEICVLKEVDIKKMDKKTRQWSMNEAKIMKEINSDYIVKYFQSFIDKEKFYICMEFCSGGDLAQLLKGQMGKPLNEETIWKFTLQFMIGLRDLHLKKILHRDIKTLNVFLTEGKDIRIGDLGVARTLTTDFASTVVGTPYYLSPEMCEEKPYNEKTDIWAMGCLVYQLCTNKHPFEANSQAALALKIVVGKYPPLPAHYSQSLSWFIKLCLSVDYKRRPTIQYLLTQPDIIQKANKLGVSLIIKSKAENVKKQIISPSKISISQVKVESKPVVKIAETKTNNSRKYDLIKKEQQRKSSLQKNKSQNKSKQKGNEKITQKQVKKQIKPIISQQNRFLPPKQKKQIVVPKLNKPELKEKNSDKSDRQPNKLQKKSKQQAKPIMPLKNQILQSPPKQATEQTLNLLIQSNPKVQRRSAQSLVDDDQLFRDFGITPEKLVVMQQKLQFKKVNTINWNVVTEDHKEPRTIEAQTLQFTQLPTIKTTSNCELIAIKSKQVDEEDVVAEQMDDNAPFKSQNQLSLSDTEMNESLLIQNIQEIEEEGDLMKKEKISLLERKIVENQKRKKQLIDLKEQNLTYILARISRPQYEKIKQIIKEGSDEEIEKIQFKQLKGNVNVVKFYKIYHFQLQIQRCNENISKCNEHIQQISVSK